MIALETYFTIFATAIGASNPFRRDPMKQPVEGMAKTLVKHPEHVKVNVASNDQTLLLWLEVAHVDIGKAIGKGGKTIDAMRTIVTAPSRHTKQDATLETAD